MPPLRKSISVICPAVTVISAYAPVPVPVTLVNGTNAYTSVATAGV